MEVCLFWLFHFTVYLDNFILYLLLRPSKKQDPSLFWLRFPKQFCPCLKTDKKLPQVSLSSPQTLLENTKILCIHSHCPQVINQYCWPDTSTLMTWSESLYSKAKKEWRHNVYCGAVQWLKIDRLHLMWKPGQLSLSVVKLKARTRNAIAVDCKT